MPAAPLLRFTACRACAQFSSVTAASIRFSYIAFRRKVRGSSASSRRSRLAAAAPLIPPALAGLATVVVAPVIRARLLRRLPVPSLAPFFGSSALRSSRVTGLLRYYGLCSLLL